LEQFRQTSSLHVSALATGNLDRMSFGGQNYHGGQNPGLDIWSYMARLGVQMRGAGDDFFAEGDGVCAMRTCQYMTQVDIEELLHDDFTEFSCQAPGCKAKFKQLIDSEAHYNAKHRHSCQECKKNLPSAHLLDLHIAESHDTYFSLMSVKKASFECFVENCKVKSWSARDRREHCIGIHSFPHDFKFEPNQRKQPSSKKVNKKAGSASPEVVKKRGQSRQKKNSGKPRPASVYVAPMETDQDQLTINMVSPLPNVTGAATPTTTNSISPPKSRSKLPVLNRRLSLNVKDYNQSTPCSSKSSVAAREPLSLAKMGQRLTAKSVFDMTTEPVAPSNGQIDMTPPTIRRLSGIPTRRGSISVKKMNSTSSTATTASVSSPDRSLTASPTKSRSSVSMNNNSPAAPSHASRDDLNGNSSPNKSRIPVLRSPSYKVPKNVCFGKGQQKAFDMKHWYQTIARSTRTASSEESNFSQKMAENFERDMKMALD